MSRKNVVIWGAGRMGRGYVADLFDAGGYHVTLVGRSPESMDRLRTAGQYTVVKTTRTEPRRDHVIAGYTALATSQADEVAAAITAADHVVVAVYPRDFTTVAQQLTPGLLNRCAERPAAPLDILLCTNLIHAAESFRSLLLQGLPREAQQYAAEHVGVVETLAMRGVVEPPADVRARDPLLVWTDGFTDFPVDRCAFKGEIPQVPGLRLVGDMRAEEVRKLYTYNMAHAALAYLGARRGYILTADSVADRQVWAEVEGALREALAALQMEYAFADGDTERWTERVLSRMDNPTLGDRVARVGADPRRKLGREDRLVGPALLALRHGLETAHLARAVAAALWFENPADSSAVYVRERVAAAGLPAAVRELCSLTSAEDDLAAAIQEAYDDLAAW
jgi:mannitol-1-phosphate 5-dehydrogenase